MTHPPSGPATPGPPSGPGRLVRRVFWLTVLLTPIVLLATATHAT